MEVLVVRSLLASVGVGGDVIWGWMKQMNKAGIFESGKWGRWGERRIGVVCRIIMSVPRNCRTGSFWLLSAQWWTAWGGGNNSPPRRTHVTWQQRMGWGGSKAGFSFSFDWWLFRPYWWDQRSLDSRENIAYELVSQSSRGGGERGADDNMVSLISPAPKGKKSKF